MKKHELIGALFSSSPHTSGAKASIGCGSGNSRFHGGRRDHSFQGCPVGEEFAAIIKHAACMQASMVQVGTLPTFFCTIFRTYAKGYG